MKKIKILNEFIKNNNQKEILKDNKRKNEVAKYLSELFKEQTEENTAYNHIILTKEQYDAMSDDIDFRIFGDILISVKYEGELDFIHYFDISNMESIKEKGLLTSYSNSKSNYGYRPDMGYGIYVIQGEFSHDMPDNIAELLLSRYDNEDEEIGYVVGMYNGEYLECINTYSHSGYYVLKEDVSLDMIKEIDSDYISNLAEDYYEYNYLDFY